MNHFQQNRDKNITNKDTYEDYNAKGL